MNSLKKSMKQWITDSVAAAAAATLSLLFISPMPASAATIQASLLPGFEANLTNTLVPQRGSGAATFTRATTATVQDWEGLIKSVLSGEARFTGARRVQNLATYSEDFGNAAWSKNGFGSYYISTVATDQVTAPNGTQTADQFTVYPTAIGSFGIAQRVSVNPSTTYVYSIWVKNGTIDSSNGGLTLFAQTYNSGTIVRNNIGSLSIQSQISTTAWTRFTLSVTTAASGENQVAFMVGAGYDHRGQTFYVWGGQLEDVTGQSNQNPSEYVSCGVLAAPYHGAGVDCVKYFNTKNGNTVASNVVTEASGQKINPITALVGALAGAVDSSGPLGYLAEGARTNLALQSQTLDNAYWNASAVGMTVTANAATAPDGTATADSMVPSNANGNHYLYTSSFPVTRTASVPVTVSLWAKKSGYQYITVQVDDGVGTYYQQAWDLTNGLVGTVTANTGWTSVSSSITAYPNGWYRLVTTGTGPGTTNLMFAISTSDSQGLSGVGDGIKVTYVWGFQAENNVSFASSYILTTTGSATRNLDVLTYPRTNNLFIAKGSAYMEVAPVWGSSGPGSSARLLSPYGTSYAQEFLGVDPGGTSVETYNTFEPGGGGVSTTFTRGVAKRIATRWGAGTRKVFAAGAASSQMAYTLTSDTGTAFLLGGSTEWSQNSAFVNIRNVKVWPRSLTDAQLTSMTGSANSAQSLAPKTTAKTPTGTGLVGYWKFDEGTGTKATDSSGRGNTGTLVSGPTWAAGKLGKAVSFDGSTNYVSVANSASLQPLTGNWSASFWIYRLGTGAGDYPEIIGSRPWTTGTDKGWAVSYSANFGKMGAHYGDGSTGFDVTSSQSASTVPLNTWQYWTVVFDRTNGKLNYYLNGQLDVQQSPTFPSGTINQTDTLYMGREVSGGNSRKLNARLDDVRVYNRALSAAEVAALYKSTAAVVNASTNTAGGSLTSGLVGLWSFDGKDINWGTGTAYDRSGSGNNGSLINMSTSTSPVIGKIGQALKFNGSSQYVNAGTQSITGSFTLSCWMKTTTVTTYQRCVEKGSYVTGWLIGITSSGRADFTVGNGSTYQQTTGLTALSPNVWYHIVGAYDSSVQKMYLYLNGASDQAPKDITGFAIGNPGSAVQIGAELSASYLFNGSLDDVRIYSRALSTTEVKALYNLGR